MTPSQSQLALWYYHAPDFLLAALIYLLVLRMLLATLPGSGRRVAALRVLTAATSPLLALTGALTPRIVPQALVGVLAVIWLLAARLALFMAVSAAGVRISMG